MPEQTYLEAIRAGLHEEMNRDAAVYLFGEDVALGGPFGVTKGLAEAFGKNRVVNTPISEGTVMGLAIGAALSGLRPVVEIMFIDFITLAMDQLVNHAAKLHYMSGGQLNIPLTVRVQCGISGNMGAHHSQSLESWLSHVPGLKVVMPSNPADAKGLLGRLFVLTIRLSSSSTVGSTGCEEKFPKVTLLSPSAALHAFA